MRVVFFEFVTNFGGARRSTVDTALRISRHAEVLVVDPYGCCSAYRSRVLSEGLAYRVLLPTTSRIVGGANQFALLRLFNLGRALPGLIRLRSRLRSLLREYRPDVVCCNETKGMALAESLGLVPVIGFMRGWYRPDTMVPYVRWMVRKRLAKLVAVSHATRTALLCAGVAPEKIAVIRNPIDVGALARSARQPLAAPLPQHLRPVRILLAANYLQAKGLHTAVAALGDLVSWGLDAVLYFCGSVPFGSDERYPDFVKDLAAQLSVSSRVEWLGVREDLPQVMLACTCVILPSISEGMPRVVLEAMALERPVVATLVGGVSDVLVPGLTGLACEIEDHRTLAQAIARITQAEEDAKEMCRVARAYMCKEYTVEQHTERVLDLFKAVVSVERTCRRM